MEGESINFLDLEPKVLFSRHGGLAEAQGVIVIQWNFQKNSVAQPFLNLSWEIDSIETTRRHTEPCPFPHLSTRRKSCLLVVVITTNLRVLKLPWRKPKFFALRSAMKQEEVAMLLMAPDDTNIMARCLLCFHSRVDVEGHGPLSALSMLSLGTLNTKAPLRVRKPRVWSTFHSWAKWLSVCHHWNILEQSNFWVSCACIVATQPSADSHAAQTSIPQHWWLMTHLLRRFASVKTVLQEVKVRAPNGNQN